MRSVEAISVAQIQLRRIACTITGLVVFLPAFILLVSNLARDGLSLLDGIELALFTLLFGQVVFGSILALTGFGLLCRGGDSLRISNTIKGAPVPEALPLTAVVMPIYNEDIARVFEGLKRTYKSTEQTGWIDAFHFFVLSDSDDPNYWIGEETAWLETCQQLDAFERIFYRKRRLNLNHKSGNLADFCRRWGAQYRYMIVLDADSVMTGKLLVQLVHLMEQNASVGIIQTAPQQVLGRSLFSRIQQFAAHLYGPLFSAGANFWHVGEGTYWGHNAIVRLEPFMKFCALPELPVVGGLGKRVLSHDSVEAAFMRRAGYGVWFAYDLEGSYEEGPPDVLASLQRDLRWCKGNMQHLLLLSRPGLTIASRVHLLIGIFGFASAPLWLLFVIISLIAVMPSPAGPSYYLGAPPATLLVYVIVWLFLPKLLGLLRACFLERRLAKSAGYSRVFLSCVGELIFSALLAPIQMLAYTRFVFAAFAGYKIKWTRQNRGDGRPTWRDEWRALRLQMIAGAIALGLVGWLAPGVLPWLAPVLAGWWLAVPFSHVTSSTEIGEQARDSRLFLIPEEIDPPPVLRDLRHASEKRDVFLSEPSELAAHRGLAQAVIDPSVNALHISLLRWREKSEESPAISSLKERLLNEGPNALKADERKLLLWDPRVMAELHRQMWSCESDKLPTWWRLAWASYIETLDPKAKHA